MDETSRWTDDRLDDRFKAIDRTLTRLDDVSQAVVNVPSRLEDAIADTHECRAGIAALRAQLDAQERQREAEKLAAVKLRAEEQQQAAEEKKAADLQAAKDKRDGRRWLVSTMLATAVFIVAALGLLFGVIGLGTA